MYPNPQDALALPPRPDAEQFRKRAKSLVKACREDDPAELTAAVRAWLESLAALLPPGQRPSTQRGIDRAIEKVTAYAREELGKDCTLTTAQFIIARVHGFPSWPRLMDHLEGRGGSAEFEAAADAVVEGRIEDLRNIIAGNPGIVHARSSRYHNAALLHYLSANGVENYRQRSPANAVDVARLLLDAGADVNAIANVYGGNSSVLNLTATSTPPKQRGVQLPLLELFLERGARIQSRDVHWSLMNGCPEAGAFLHAHGAPLDLVDAAGIGDLNAVNERLADTSTERKAEALVMATWYDRREIISSLVRSGLSIDVRAGGEGETSLHVAAYSGNAALCAFLLEQGAQLEITDTKYGTTPLAWAAHALIEERNGRSDRHKATVQLLVDRGARVPDSVKEALVEAGIAIV
jgi:hypothetical protein